MEFSSPLWFLPLFVLPGLWLAVRLYVRGPAASRRPVLAIVYAAGWLGVGLLALSPRWRYPSETWNPPLVVLAVDQSGSYAALGADDSARRLVRKARAHYTALGFKVVETGFDPSTSSGISDLRRRLSGQNEGNGNNGRGGAAYPNLQAVLVWTDGRFGSETESANDGVWPAPVYPVRVPVASGEVQGEKLEIDFASPDGSTGPELTGAWRSLGSGAGASESPAAILEIRDGAKIVWRAELKPASNGSAGIPSGEIIPINFRLPAALAASDPAKWIALVRPVSLGRNRFTDNDTVALDVRGKNRPVRFVIRPVASLGERALLDALRDPDPEAARAVDVAALPSMHASRRDVVWVRADSRERSRALTAAQAAGAPVVVYETTASGSGGSAVFGSDARLGWRADGGTHLPAGALRLADLGVNDGGAGGTGSGGLRLRAPDASVEPLAWAEESGKRGLLIWKNRNDGTFGFALPPMWNAAFGARARSQEVLRSVADVSALWARGASDWAGALSNEAGARSSSEKKAESASSPSVSGARESERSRLGDDVEALVRWAIRGNGNVVSVMNIIGNDNRIKKSGTTANASESVWPALPGGQTRATSSRVIAFAPPFATALLIACVFSFVWWMRKRLRLD